MNPTEFKEVSKKMPARLTSSSCDGISIRYIVCSFGIPPIQVSVLKNFIFFFLVICIDGLDFPK